MPAMPEFPGIPGKIGEVEIIHGFKAEDAGNTLGDIGIAGKVPVYLKSEGIAGHEIFKSCWGRCFRENRIDQKGHIISNEYLQEQTPKNMIHPELYFFPGDEPFLSNLREKLRRPFYGSGEQLGEKGNVNCIMYEITGGGNFSPVNIYCVTDRFEGVEGYADGQEQPNVFGMNLQSAQCHYGGKGI